MHAQRRCRRRHPGQERVRPDRRDRGRGRRGCPEWTSSSWSTTGRLTAPPPSPSAAGASVMRHARNRGKAAAMETGAEAVRLLEAGPAPGQPASPAVPRRRPGRDRGRGRRRWPSRCAAGQADMTIAVFSNRVQQGGHGFVMALSGSGIERATGWRPAQPLNGQRCLTRAAFEAARPLAPRLGRGDRAHHRPAPPGPARRPRSRCRSRTAPPAATGGPSCTGRASSPTSPGRWRPGSRRPRAGAAAGAARPPAAGPAAAASRRLPGRAAGRAGLAASAAERRADVRRRGRWARR